ncbi:MAG: FtsX-like permease family protein [Lachnospiraceae bacterium]|nr:FtsX-like permease family protein [Lachnospiraceae bacterium]
MQRIRTLFYCMKQGIRSVWKNRVYSLASAGTITACLLLLGVFYFVVANFNYAMKSAESMVGITVFFERGTTEARMMEIKEEIRLRVEVDHIVYISAEEAWETYKKENLSAELIETFGSDNPLEDSASLEVYLNDVTMQKALVRFAEDIDGVRKVNHSESVAESFAGIETLVLVISVGLIAILVAVAVFLIRTTISTGISVRREEISIMSIFGATDFFIRAPFVVEGLIIGFLGTILPVGLLYVVYGEVVATLKEQFEGVFTSMKFLDRVEIMNRFVPIALLFSLGIGLVASHVTAKRQIRKIEMQH